MLEYAMTKEVSGDGLRKHMREALGDKKGDEVFKALPIFRTSYEAWYSESLALLRQILPDRVSNFVGLYEKPKGRKGLDAGNYVIQDYLQDLIATQGGMTKVGPIAALPQYRQQLAIL